MVISIFRQLAIGNYTHDKLYVLLLGHYAFIYILFEDLTSHSFVYIIYECIVFLESAEFQMYTVNV